MENAGAYFSLLLAVIFIVAGVQILGGKTSFLGEDVEKSIKPEDKKAYCREISVPIFLLGIVEAADGIMQFTMGENPWSMLILGIGILLGLGWVMMIQRKYTRR